MGNQVSNEQVSEFYALQSKATNLENALEASQSKVTALENALKTATKKEQELLESLDLTTTEKKQLEDTLRKSSEQLVETEKLLKVSQSKLEGIETELEATKTRETEAIQKLKSVEEELQEKVTFHETQTRNSELKIQEAVAKFTSRDTEAKSLLEKSRNLEEQLKAYEVQLAESAGTCALLKEELDQLVVVKTNIESANKELNDKVVKTTNENKMLVATIIQIKDKINELEISLKESTTQKLIDSTIADLTDQHSRAYEIGFKEGKELTKANLKLTQEVAIHESRLNDLQKSLSAALKEKDETLNQLHISKKEIEHLTEKFTSQGQTLQSQISSLVEENNMLKETHENANKELQTFMATLEGEVKEHESNETSLKTELEHLKAEMEESVELKNNLKNLEKKLAAAQNTIVEQKEIHSQKELERDAALKEVEAKKASLSHLEETQIKDLTQNLNAKPKEEELQTSIATLQGEVKEHTSNETSLKTELEHLKAEMEENAELKKNLKNLEKKLPAVQNTIVEQKETHSQKELERDVALKEVEAHKTSLSHMEETQIKDLTHKVNAKPKEEELQTIIATFKGEVKEHASNETSLKTELKHLKAEMEENAELKNNLKNLEKKLPIAQNTIVEQKETQSQKELEKDAPLKEVEANKSSLSHLEETQIKDLTQNLNAKPKEEELQTFIAILEGEVKEHTSNETSLKTELEHLKAETEENAELKNNLMNLEKKLPAAQNTIVEQKETHSQKELERDAALKEVEAQKASLSHMEETQIKDLTQKLNGKPKEEVDEVKSRELGSTPTNRKNKKRVEGTSSSTTSNTQIESNAGSFGTSFKFILGVALVSIIVGIVRGTTKIMGIRCDKSRS